MVTWTEFQRLAPDLSQEGQALLYEFGVGLAFLATVRRDGGPRVHPMCPIAADSGLYAFLVPSPKRTDLHRDGRYAMHSFPLADNEDAFYLTGTAAAVDDARLRNALAEQFAAERTAVGVPPPGEEQELFAFDIATAMLTRTSGHGDPAPRHTVWHAPATDADGLPQPRVRT